MKKQTKKVPTKVETTNGRAYTKSGELKSLKTLQVFAKVAYIVVFVLFIVGIVAAAGLLIAAIVLMACRNVYIDGRTFENWIKYTSDNTLSLQTIALTLINGAVFSCGEVAVSVFAKKYFKNVLLDKTFFTHQGAKEVLKLGIIDVAVASCCAGISAIIYAIFIAVFPNAYISYVFFEYTGYIIGLFFILLSFFFRYGADLRRENNIKDTSK